MPWLPYNSHKERQYNGNAVDVLTAALKIMILTDGYTPDRTTHAFKADVDPDEVSGGGYAAGGVALTGLSLTFDGTTLIIDCDDAQIAQDAGGFTDGRYAILYTDVGVASTSPLWGYYDFGGDRGNVAGPLKLKTPNGLWRM